MCVCVREREREIWERERERERERGKRMYKVYKGAEESGRYEKAYNFSLNKNKNENT